MDCMSSVGGWLGPGEEVVEAVDRRAVLFSVEREEALSIVRGFLGAVRLWWQRVVGAGGVASVKVDQRDWKEANPGMGSEGVGGLRAAVA